MASYLHSWELCVFKLFQEDDLTLSDLFGNVLKYERNEKDKTGKIHKVKMDLNISLFLWTKPNPRKKVFRRGYNDHGSLADPNEKARTQELKNELSQFVLEEELKQQMRELRFENQILFDLLRLEQGYR